MEDELRYFSHLIQSLQLLAAEYSVQIRALPDFVDKPDEIALIFYDCFLLANQILKVNLITREQYEKLADMDRKTSIMSDEKKCWTLKSLKHDPEWKELRVLAKNLLSEFGIPQDEPDLNWIFFVGGNESSSS